jgi:transcriptional regulator with GAF, ATPase, and Fis domain
MSRRTKSVPSKPRLGTAGPRSTGRLQRAIDATVRKEIQAALRETAGNLAAAARLLGVTEMAIRKRLRSLQIDPNRFR